MECRLCTTIILVLALVGIPGAVGAAGFQLLEQNASGLGNAYAGSAVVAEDASTIYFNPAGMTQLASREVSGGLACVRPRFRFHNASSSAGQLSGAGDGGNAGDLAAVPNGFVSWAMTPELYAGIGITVPFGLKTEYHERWIGAAQSTLFEIKTINVNPSLAYRLNDVVSLGGGLNWQRIEAEYARLAGTAPGVSGVKSTMSLEDSALGWNIGALVRLSPSASLGLSYRSKVKYHSQGDVKLVSDGSAAANAALATLVATGRQSDLKADLTLPDTFILSASQRLDPRWELLADVSWTGWSSIPKVDIMRTSGLLSGRSAQVLETKFRDTWRVALGTNYQLNDEWTLKFGAAYDQTPVKRAETRMTSLPDNDRAWLSMGAQWRQRKSSRVDLALAYIHIRDSQIANDQTAYARGRVDGVYEGNIWVLAAQYSVAF